MVAPLPITVYSDVICPWCYVGKRRLEVGLSAADAQVSLEWRPFELNPDMPEEGMERATYRARKFGADRSAELDRNMAAIGREAGIDFAFDHMQRTPNTRLAHRLIWEAGRQGRQNAVVNALFRAYFEDALDIGSREILVRLAVEAELEPGGAERALSSAESLEAVMEMEQQGYRMGIQGVPFFIVAAKYGVSGAQPPQFWIEALPRIVAEADERAPPA